MLPRPPAEIAIEEITREYAVHNGSIHTTLLRGPKFHTRSRPPRQAILIHGEGLGVNHTLLSRPARWLIAKDCFDQLILPDRRGCGRSSALVRPLTPAEGAEDLRRLLDALAEAGHYDPAGPLAAIGVSFGGLVALALAGAHPRITCAALLAVSPVRRRPGLLMRLMLCTGLFDKLLNWQLKRALGRRPKKVLDFDPGYDAPDGQVMAGLFNQAVQHTPAERGESLRLDYTAALDPFTARLPAHLTLTIPILQITGEADEIWDPAPSAETLADLSARFPNLTRKTIPGAALHNDVYLMPEPFHTALAEGLKEICPDLSEQ